MTDRTPADVLRAARELVFARNRWTQGHYAKDDSGLGVEWDNPDAVCFCAVGAIHRACEREDEEIRDIFRSVIRSDPRKPWLSIVDWNDEKGRTHAEVIAAFDKAIALAEQEQS